jgi:hypothetical protein
MKKFTLFLAALAVTATAFAAGPIEEQPAGTLKNYTREGKSVVCDYEDGFYVAYQEGKVSIVFAEDGQTVYMKDPLHAMAYGTWAQGTLSEDGKTITIPMGQVIYHSPYYDADVILSWGSTTEGMINWDTYSVEVEYTPDESVEAAVFTIDGETIRLEGSTGAEVLTAEDLAEFAATGLSAIWADTRGWVQTIEWGTVLTELPPAQPAVPANPEIIEWRDMGNQSGYNRLEFRIDPVDVDGNPLDLEQGQLTYSVFTDYDQLFTFDAVDYYWDFDGEEVTEVPYNQYSYNFSPQSIFFYRTNAEGYDRFFEWRIGMQVYYTASGVRNASDIVYLEVFDEPEPPTPEEGVILVIVDQDNVEHAFNLTQGDDGDFSTTVTLDYVPYGQFYWDPNLSYAENDANRPAVPFYFLINGQRYGAEDMRPTVLGFAMQNPLDSELDGFYTVPVGFSYNLGVAHRDGVYYVYAAVSTPTAVDELTAKTVAGVRYYNVMGQEMAQPEGMTIQVTTYTDGTTSTVKVMK